jgi:hypothetical protein
VVLLVLGWASELSLLALTTLPENRVMATSNLADMTAASPAASVPTYRRTPRRITITISWSLYELLINRSDHEGRSLSNLAAHLLELGAR